MITVLFIVQSFDLTDDISPERISLDGDTLVSLADGTGRSLPASSCNPSILVSVTLPVEKPGTPARVVLASRCPSEFRRAMDAVAAHPWDGGPLITAPWGRENYPEGPAPRLPSAPVEPPERGVLFACDLRTGFVTVRYSDDNGAFLVADVRFQLECFAERCRQVGPDLFSTASEYDVLVAGDELAGIAAGMGLRVQVEPWESPAPEVVRENVPEPTAIPVPVPAPERYTYTGKSKSSKPRRLVIKYSVQRARPFYGDDETVGERLARTARERAWLTAHAPTALDAWAQDYGAVLELQRRVAYARF